MPESGVELAFVCQRCNALSPMAAAIAEGVSPEVAAASAGTNPDGRILPGALTALREVGIDTTGIAPAPVQRAQLEAADAVVAIGPGLVDDPIFEGLSPEQWEIDNPEGGQLAAFRRARDDLGLRVRELLREEGLDLDDPAER
ncbi:heat-shock protein HtpX [Thermoplasmatales archaeon SW_10_69_26]|nr:MAG: heat-shock protein HtpX [Thermoplasmatales archaeon SW_10_69_26]